MLRFNKQYKHILKIQPKFLFESFYNLSKEILISLTNTKICMYILFIELEKS